MVRRWYTSNICTCNMILSPRMKATTWWSLHPCLWRNSSHLLRLFDVKCRHTSRFSHSFIFQEFRPSRFEDYKNHDRDPYTYVPFSAGPRSFFKIFCFQRKTVLFWHCFFLYFPPNLRKQFVENYSTDVNHLFHRWCKLKTFLKFFLSSLLVPIYRL